MNLHNSQSQERERDGRTCVCIEGRHSNFSKDGNLNF